MSEFVDPLTRMSESSEFEEDALGKIEHEQVVEEKKNEVEVEEEDDDDDDDIFKTEGKTEEKSEEIKEEDIIDLVNDGSLSKQLKAKDKNLSELYIDDQQDLFVSVEKPEKVILSMETYIVYNVVTKTTRSAFDDSEYKVKRRYQDFVWLRGKLEEEHQTHLLPPLPSKFIVKGMVDRFSPEFVGTRCRALDSFLKRIAEHPVVSCSEHLKLFIITEDFSAHRKQNKPGLLSRVGGTVKSAASVGSSIRSKGRDPEFAEMSDHVANFKEQMAVTDRVAERLLGEEKELANDLKEFGPTYTAWASTENQILAPIMTSLAKCIESCAESAEKNAENHELYFIPPLKEYILYCDGIEQVFKRRDTMQHQRDRCLDDLTKRKDEKNNIPGSDQSYSFSAILGKKPDDVKQQKEEKINQQIQELTSRYEELSDSLEKANGDLKSDMERWKFNKKQDTKQIFAQLAESHIEHQTQCLSAWESLIPLMQGKIDFGDLGGSNDLEEDSKDSSKEATSTRTSISNENFEDS